MYIQDFIGSLASAILPFLFSEERITYINVGIKMGRMDIPHAHKTSAQMSPFFEYVFL